MTALVISDLHLSRAAPDITSRCLEFLTGKARSVAALYILGDLFESWLGDDDPDPELERVVSALADVAGRGVALYVMHGNRDFLIGSGFARATGATLLNDPTIVTHAGCRLLMTHGDALCVDDVPYQKLRATVRDPALQRAVLRLPLRTRATVIGDAREGSKAHTGAQSMALMDVNGVAVEDAFRRAGVDVILHGHTHRPDVHDLLVDGRTRRRIVLGDWYTSGSYVLIDRGGATLHGLTAG